MGWGLGRSSFFAADFADQRGSFESLGILRLRRDLLHPSRLRSV